MRWLSSLIAVSGAGQQFDMRLAERIIGVSRSDSFVEVSQPTTGRARECTTDATVSFSLIRRFGSRVCRMGRPRIDTCRLAGS